MNAPLSGIERLQIIEKKIDILNPQSVDLVIGSKSQSLSAYQLQSQEAIESIERVKANQDIENKREKLLTLTSELERLRNERKPDNTERIRALEAEIIKIRNELGGS
ncbi:putative membrane metallo-endo-peptidase [Streptococcus pneumoniae]|nr:putative membrane metallo-endo-peptidase [Streptococcus pneumoniae]